MAKREKSENQVKLAAAKVALVAARETVKSLKLAMVGERDARKLARKDAVTAAKAARAAKKAAKAEKLAESKTAKKAKIEARVARAQAALAKLNAPKALKRKSRKASAVKVLVENGVATTQAA